jgi:hypothetical protein
MAKQTMSINRFRFMVRDSMAALTSNQRTQVPWFETDAGGLASQRLSSWSNCFAAGKTKSLVTSISTSATADLSAALP